ncbi:hypothetical protein H2198_004209 [Neophaeococcomyces mojaviensis]|uniref:Uncharacterized protein n=1 Tax=Neophaeococcomyces mojaviensis TaxID=3383035 RepID=A0ACC3A940_9EURO|nr:hypothetical protein H2198_004209 [Knufia sp. JES_112]
MAGQGLRPIQEDRTSTSRLDSHAILDPTSSEDDTTPTVSVQGSSTPRTSSQSSADDSGAHHVIKLSSIEDVMPRAYIRICYVYRVPDEQRLDSALARLRCFVRQTIDAKPYLAGYVTDVETKGNGARRSEIRFSTHDFLSYPQVEARVLLDDDGEPLNYAELDKQGCPPSWIRPEKVSALQENVGPEDRSAPVFRVQANILQGGLVVSFYLHHCISDGTGFDLLTTGDLMHDSYSFKRNLSSRHLLVEGLEDRLKLFAAQKTAIRYRLSEASPNQLNTRQLQARRRDQDPPFPQSKPGRGCIIMISWHKIESAYLSFNFNTSTTKHTRQSILMALLWRHMTRARRPSVSESPDIKTSRLFIPVDIRQRLNEPLPAGYFGSAVDSATAKLSLDALTAAGGKSLEEISTIIRRAVDRVDDSYVRECIALANSADALTDVSDVQASNMNRSTGADMYITSWLRLRSYQCDLGMGLGGPDWVRKPWSRDPGSCIILPQKGPSPDYYEAVVQMTETDMERLLHDKDFMDFVIRVID